MAALTTGYLKRSRFKLLCILALFAGSNACGQIGPLYLPENAPPATESAESDNSSTPAGESSTEERDTKDKPNSL